MWKSSHKMHYHHQHQHLMPLAWCNEGNTVELVSIQGGRKMQNRINELGIIPGTKIKVLQSRNSGPVLIEYRGSKLVLGHGIARHMFVK